MLTTEQGEYDLDDGKIGNYEGSWLEDLPDGEGTWVFGATTYSGSWKQGKYDGRGMLTRHSYTYNGRCESLQRKFRNPGLLPCNVVV